jgi:molybdopterin converting factor small subunit
MKVKLRLLGTLSNIGLPEQEVCLPENTSVTNLLDFLNMQFGEEFGRRINHLGMWQISINGSVHLLSCATATTLQDQDDVVIFPISFGG